MLVSHNGISLFGMYDIYAQLEGHICFWHILAVTCEIEVAVGYVLAHIIKKVWSMCLCSMLPVWAVFGI